MTRTGGQAGCVFCEALAGDEASLVVFRGVTCYVILNKFPYNNGHLMVVPNRHVASLGEATAEELQRAHRARATGGAGDQGDLRAAWPQHGHQPGQASRRRDSRSPAHARRSAMERRHELHDRRRRNPRAAGRADGDRRPAAPGVRPSCPKPGACRILRRSSGRSMAARIVQSTDHCHASRSH